MLQRSSTTKKCSRVLANFLGFEILEHPPYSQDLAPMDLRVFLEIKGKLPGMRFEEATELCIYFILKSLFHHTPVTGFAISMLNGNRDIENAFKFVVITLKKCD